MKQTQPKAYYSKLKVLAGYTLDKKIYLVNLYLHFQRKHIIQSQQMDLFYCFYDNWLPFRATKWNEWWKNTLYGKLIPSSLSPSYSAASLKGAYWFKLYHVSK